MVDQPNRCQTWLPTLRKIENLTKNRHLKDDSGQRWFKLAQYFQRRRSFYKSLRMTDGRRTPSEGKSSPDSLGQVS
jgi:hypothetical protein